mmetsp:Transcript_71841/g.181270  ORF Transcript_71841/g.181270 Transcript_71841/m.181270 type:complete len:483 (-) Transcript_71841:199-1647(-)
MWQLGRQTEPHRRAMPNAVEELTVIRRRSISTAREQMHTALLVSAAVAPQSARRAAATPRQRGGAAPPKALPTSVERGAATKPPAIPQPASHAYQWTPFHVRKKEPAVAAAAPVNLEEYGTGFYVNTLTMDVRNNTFEGAVPHLLRLDPTRFVPKGHKPWVYMLRGSIPCIAVKGLVVCVAPPHEERDGEPLVVAQLPEDMRPARPLRFAALARDTARAHHPTTTSKLVTLVATPDGLITAEDGRAGCDEIHQGCEIDMSAIRFCMGNGISLIDDAHLYLCDVNGTRLVCLQGSISERFFNVDGRKRLALLPASCRPPCEISFVSAGTVGGYHLLVARPDAQGNLKDSGELVWRDSKWHRDTICLNGLIWEVMPEALLFENPMTTMEATESQVIAIMDFQRYLRGRFGSIESAWHEAFDTDGSGSVNFTEFTMGCKSAGFVGNATRLWAALDDDRSGALSLEELAHDEDSRSNSISSSAEPG